MNEPGALNNRLMQPPKNPRWLGCCHRGLCPGLGACPSQTPCQQRGERCGGWKLPATSTMSPGTRSAAGTKLRRPSLKTVATSACNPVQSAQGCHAAWPVASCIGLPRDEIPRQLEFCRVLYDESPRNKPSLEMPWLTLGLASSRLIEDHSTQLLREQGNERLLGFTPIPITCSRWSQTRNKGVGAQ